MVVAGVYEVPRRRGVSGDLADVRCPAFGNITQHRANRISDPLCSTKSMTNHNPPREVRTLARRR
ncbi:hypothetical protein GCM10018952_07500 [Streptosporangium vulgare]